MSSLVCGLALFAGERYVPLHYWLADQRTATGEQRTLTLADGTLINLNTHSAMDVRFDEKRRLIVLQEGEILVETGHNDARPVLSCRPATAACARWARGLSSSARTTARA